MRALENIRLRNKTGTKRAFGTAKPKSNRVESLNGKLNLDDIHLDDQSILPRELPIVVFSIINQSIVQDVGFAGDIISVGSIQNISVVGSVVFSDVFFIESIENASIIGDFALPDLIQLESIVNTSIIGNTAIRDVISVLSIVNTSTVGDVEIIEDIVIINTSVIGDVLIRLTIEVEEITNTSVIGDVNLILTSLGDPDPTALASILASNNIPEFEEVLIGNNGERLTVDSTTSTGVNWKP